MKSDLHDYLRGARETVVWKLEGLSEYDIRRPVTQSGTSLLGLVKHTAWEQFIYFGDIFDRPPSTSLPWMPTTSTPYADLWATPDELTEEIIACCHQSWEFADATIDSLSLDATGRVPWWDNAPVTLHQILVHVTANLQRHAGHADIVRESIDGTVGLLREAHSMRVSEPAELRRLHDQIEKAARLARG